MAKSNTNKPLSASLEQIVDRAMLGSMKDLRKEVQQDHYRIRNAVSQFFDLFAAMAIDTNGPPNLGAYTPSYTPLSSAYAAKKPAGAGFFKKTGQLQDDVRNLSSQTTNLLGKSSFYIEQSSRGAKKGFSQGATGVRSLKTGKFVSASTGLKNFKVKVVHTPFSKVDASFKPVRLERDIFKGAYDEIFDKLTNQQSKGKNAPYRPAFYSFMRWWLNVHLKEVLK